jgi:hypothetical protein
MVNFVPTDGRVYATAAETVYLVVNPSPPKDIPKPPTRPSSPVNSNTESMGAIELDEFNSFSGVTVSNRINEVLFLLHIGANLTEEHESITLSLESPIGPHETKHFRFSPPGGATTLPPMGETWPDHWAAAEQTYKHCVMTLYFSPSSLELKEVQDHYRAQGVTLPVGEASGVVSFRTTSGDLREESFPLKAILVKMEACQP